MNEIIEVDAAYLRKLQNDCEMYRKERDAAVAEISKNCGTCKHNFSTPADYSNCDIGISNCNWEWRGVAMSDLISRAALIKKLNAAALFKLDNFQDGEARGLLQATELVTHAPSVDAVGVMHGHWIPIKCETGVEAFGVKEMTVEGFECSVCGEEIDVSEGHFNFCPNCGAKIDEVSQ